VRPLVRLDARLPEATPKSTTTKAATCSDVLRRLPYAAAC
jgi:hypothetical protein